MITTNATSEIEIETPISESPGSSLALPEEIQNPQSLIANRQSALAAAADLTRNLPDKTATSSTDIPLALPSSVSSACSASSAVKQKSAPKVIDTADIPFPKTVSELHALDATREIPYLKALCNRRQIHTPGKNPTSAQIIPIIEHILTAHIAKLPRGLSQTCDIYVEWKLIHDDLAEFLAQLKSLLPDSASVSSVNSVLIPSPSHNPPPPNTSQTSGHSNNSSPTNPKTPAISTNPNQNSKILGHSNNSPQKFSPPPNPQSPIRNRPRKIHPILSRLTQDQKQQLILIYEQNSSLEATRLAQEKLGIQISSGSMSRLYSTWQIAEDNDTRQDLEAAHNASIEELTEKQLQLRLLEQASRPNMDHTELRTVCHSFARLQSLKLSARRVQLAESKEARIAQNAEPARDFSVEETVGGIRAMLGRAPDDDRDYSGETEQIENPNDDCRRRGDESLTNSAPETPSNPNPSSNPDEVGRVAPRADETLPNNQNEPSVKTTPDNSINHPENKNEYENCSMIAAQSTHPANEVLPLPEEISGAKIVEIQRGDS